MTTDSPKPDYPPFIEAGIITTDKIPSGSIATARIDEKHVIKTPEGGYMLRYNAGKLRLSLIPTSFTRQFVVDKLPLELYKETSKVLNFGAQKYDSHNWRKSGSWASVYDSLMRHVLLGLKAGEDNDPESNLSHWGHIGCNLAFLREYVKEESGIDDRFIPKNPYVNILGDNNIDNLILTMLEWLDGGSVNVLEKAIRIAAHVCENDKKVSK